MASKFDWKEILSQQSLQEVSREALPEHVEIDPRNGEPIEAKSVSEGAGIRSLDDIHIDDLLRESVERKASDLHITVALPPTVRVDGELTPLPYEIVRPEVSHRLIYEILSDERITILEKTRELDFSHSVKDIGRFRVNVYYQRGSLGAALRVIPQNIPTFEELRLPPVLREITKRTSGLILVTGATGSGKSTTIAAMVDDINSSRRCHIMTIEDPIEYLYHHKMAMVNQREVHHDTLSFQSALRAVLREDPDVIVVGELRDLETITAALTLAETGHLVFGTLHTRNAPQSIDRLIDVFPPEQQEQIRVLLSNTLESIISQQLIPKLGGGRIVAVEILVATPAIRNLIREAKTHQMYSVIETSAQQGMITMDRSLLDLYRNGYITHEDALMRAVDQENFGRLAKSVA